jgi:hypothetical protein
VVTGRARDAVVGATARRCLQPGPRQLRQIGQRAFFTRPLSRKLSRSRIAGGDFRFGIVSMNMAHANRAADGKSFAWTQYGRKDSPKAPTFKLKDGEKFGLGQTGEL